MVLKDWFESLLWQGCDLHLPSAWNHWIGDLRPSYHPLYPTARRTAQRWS